MPDDVRTVPVTFQLDPQTAAALEDAATHDRVEQSIRRMVRDAKVDHLFEAIRTLKDDAHSKGLTDEIVDEELAAYNAERRERRTAG